MKKKILVLSISICFSLCILYTGFGEWHDSIEAVINITPINSSPVSKNSQEVDQKGVTTDKSSPEDIKSKEEYPKITITQQIDETNTFNFDSSWELVGQ